MTKISKQQENLKPNGGKFDLSYYDLYLIFCDNLVWVRK